MIRKLAWGYAFFFFLVVLSGHLPGLTDSHGLLFGMFMIDPIDDVLHSISGIWAAFGAWKSEKEARRYFQWFGIYYTTDAFLGFFTGYSILDLLMGNFGANMGYSMANMHHNLLVNLPHFIIGPGALLIGFLVKDTVKKVSVVKTSKKTLSRKKK